MDILDYAKEIESQGIEHYSNLAKEVELKELESIFEFLVREEKRHYEIFDSWQKESAVPSVDNTGILTQAKGAFQKLSDHFKTASFVAIDRDEAYNKALEFENKSISLYTDALDKLGDGMNDGKYRDTLKSIIDQEKKHARLITSLKEFQRHPGEWLENAEWYHFDQY
ncbi:MAG: hypothetical protein GF401_14135 [Chitinivibrionales bacterium]|nr:hypothetical protein [Chitinivibrionales bacterium]